MGGLWDRFPDIGNTSSPKPTKGSGTV